MKRQGSILPIALMAFAIVSFLVLVNFAVTPQTGTNTTNGTQNVNVTVTTNENQNVSVNANGNTNAANGNANAAVNANVAVNANTTVDATKDWKTYSSSKYNISFSYPADWKVSEGAISTPYKIDVYPGTSSGWSTTGAITFWVGNSYSTRCGENPVSKTSSVTIGGIPATLYTVTDSKISTCKFRSYLLERTPLGWTNLDNVGKNEIQVMSDSQGSFTTQDLVLGTLKLSDPTAGWKTYTNETYGFGFKYPNNLKLNENPTVQGSDVYDVANISSDTQYMSVSVLGRVLDPNDVQDAYGKVTTTTVQIGQQSGYAYTEGDAGCGGTMIQTVLKNEKTLRVSFITCDPKTNTLDSNISERNQVLSTFTFTK